jgi:hypothetical protein
MKPFVNQCQIVGWAIRVNPVGPCSVLKRIEHGLCLVIQVETTGRTHGTITVTR